MILKVFDPVSFSSKVETTDTDNQMKEVEVHENSDYLDFIKKDLH